MIPYNPCFDELWFEILSSEMCIEMCIFARPNNFTKVSCYSYRHLVFFVVLGVEILDFIADFEVDLIALSSALHACGIASRWEQASPGQWTVGISKAVLKASIMEHDEMDMKR